MNFHDLKNKNWYPYTVAACAAVLLAFFLMHLDAFVTIFSFIWKIISPLVAGAIIAYIMDPIARIFENNVFPKIEKVKLGRKAAVACSCLAIFGGLAILISILVPSIMRSISYLIENLDSYENTAIGLLKKYGITSEQLLSNIELVVDSLKDKAPTITMNAIESSSKMGGTLGNLGLGCILAIYFMLYKSRIVKLIIGITEKLVNKEYYPKFVDFCSRCNVILLKYISCSLLEALFVGCSNAVLMLIFRMPNIALISVIVGVTNLAPTFGPLIGGVIGFILLAFSSPRHAFIFIIITIVIQTIDGYVVKPKLFGNSLGVSSLWILIAIICGGKVFGITGVVLAIPFAAIVQYLLEEILFPKVREEKKNNADRVEEPANIEIEDPIEEIENIENIENIEK